MAIDKVVLPDNLQDETPVEGAKDVEEMIIILARKMNEIIDEVNK